MASELAWRWESQFRNVSGIKTARWFSVATELANSRHDIIVTTNATSLVWASSTFLTSHEIRKSVKIRKIECKSDMQHNYVRDYSSVID